MANNVIKKRKPEQGNDWALTLADMMTLLLCFFVIMLSMSSVDKQKYEMVSDFLSEAMGGKREKFTGQPANDIRMEVAPRQVNLFELQLELARLIGKEAEAIRLNLRPDAVAINLKGRVFFPSGKADLTPRARGLLQRIAPPLVESHYDLTVEGHTDNVPISSAQFPSNWELSGARASAVARFLIDKGLPAKRVKVLGLADTRPEVPNFDKTGAPIMANQARNRRVTILVHPKEKKD